MQDPKWLRSMKTGETMKASDVFASLVGTALAVLVTLFIFAAVVMLMTKAIMMFYFWLFG